MQHHLQQHVAEDCPHIWHQKMRKTLETYANKIEKYRDINVFRALEIFDILHLFHF